MPQPKPVKDLEPKKPVKGGTKWRVNDNITLLRTSD
jgi:hypothetical protein